MKKILMTLMVLTIGLSASSFDEAIKVAKEKYEQLLKVSKDIEEI